MGTKLLIGGVGDQRVLDRDVGHRVVLPVVTDRTDVVHLVVADGTSGGAIELRISGLSAGTHTLLAYHNAVDGNQWAEVNGDVNGARQVTHLATTNRALSTDDAASSHVTFTVSGGETVTILYSPNLSSSASSKNVILNAIALDLPVQGISLLTREASPVVANVGGGIALLGTRYRATAEQGYRANDDHLLTAAPILDLRVGTPLSETVALVATGAVLSPLRSDRLVFEGREVARHGAVLVTGGLGVQITLR